MHSQISIEEIQHSECSFLAIISFSSLIEFTKKHETNMETESKLCQISNRRNVSFYYFNSYYLVQKQLFVRNTASIRIVIISEQ